MDLNFLEKVLRESWSKETCYSPLADKWNEENPALGQCLVTALVVQDYFGGELRYCEHQDHYWNRLADKTEVDFTRMQFPNGTAICFDSVITRRNALYSIKAVEDRTEERYLLLKERVNKLI